MENANARNILETSNEWFSISNTGWRRLNAGREMGHLIREAVSNVYDLSEVKNCEVTIEEGHVIIEDDSPAGFANLSLITTIFLTDKEDDVTKRGRKGRGLKELISAADKAEVQTVGGTIIFESGRKAYENDRKAGTRVEIWTSLDNWKGENVQKAIDYITNTIPPENLTVKINGKEVPKKQKLFIIENTYLETVVIEKGVESHQYRATTIELYRKQDGAYLYEMGIAVQQIDCDYSINVLQRIPVNDKRDTVSNWYLSTLFGGIMSSEDVINLLVESDVSKDWISRGIDRAPTDIQKKIVSVFTGDKNVRKTDNQKANDTAATAGYKLMDVNLLPAGIRSTMERFMQTSNDIAKREAEQKEEKIKPDTAKKKFVKLITYLAKKLIDCDITVEFISRDLEFSGILKVAGFNVETKTLTYNVQSSSNEFDNPLSEANLAVLVHELAHFYTQLHDEEHTKHIERISGKLARLCLTESRKLYKLAGERVISGKTVTITCIDCGSTREVKPQDVHQVKRCVACQQLFRRPKKGNGDA